MHILFKEELFLELIFQGAVLIDFDRGIVYNTFTQNLMGYTNNTGYCAIAWKYHGRAHHILVHRLIWMAAYGPIPTGMQINHINGVKTDNRLCNLELVTPQQNVQHAYRTGLADAQQISIGLSTYYARNRHKSAKLTNDQVDEIKRLRVLDPRKYTLRQLGIMYGMDHKNIYHLLNEQTYKQFCCFT